MSSSRTTQGCNPAVLPKGFSPCFIPLQLLKDVLGTRGKLVHRVIFEGSTTKKGKDGRKTPQTCGWNAGLCHPARGVHGGGRGSAGAAAGSPGRAGCAGSAGPAAGRTCCARCRGEAGMALAFERVAAIPSTRHGGFATAPTVSGWMRRKGRGEPSAPVPAAGTATAPGRAQLGTHLSTSPSSAGLNAKGQHLLPWQ